MKKKQWQISCYIHAIEEKFLNLINIYIYIPKKKKKERKANIISNIGKQCFLRLETIHGCLLSTFLPKIKPEV